MTLPVTLPTPNFIDRDPNEITGEMITAYQTAAGRPLRPAQVERLIIDILAYRETLARIGIQNAGLQTLLAFAAFPMIDYLGDLVGVARLQPQLATTTIRFTLSAVQTFDVIIPQGTRVQTLDGKVIFQTSAQAVCTAGSAYVDVASAAATGGVIGNGYVAGQINALLDVIANVSTASNTTTSSGGVDIEADDALRERIREAPEGFSVAGPVGAYRFHAMSVSQLITDVQVISPEPGTVALYVLTSSGLPSDDLLAAVLAACDDKKVRPLSDTVEVHAPSEVDFTIEAALTLYSNVDIATTLAAAQAAAVAYAADRRSALGKDLVPTQLLTLLSVPGVYDVELTYPTLTEVDQTEWANCTGISVTFAGAVDG
jgi:phage-related baseplate assembly protein